MKKIVIILSIIIFFLVIIIGIQESKIQARDKYINLVYDSQLQAERAINIFISMMETVKICNDFHQRLIEKEESYLLKMKNADEGYNLANYLRDDNEVIYGGN